MAIGKPPASATCSNAMYNSSLRLGSGRGPLERSSPHGPDEPASEGAGTAYGSGCHNAFT
jgi:hypothetical protein